MIGFKTARALVVDDNPDEALPVIKALGKLGISSVFWDAELRTDPDKYDGIRLLCLDMILSETRGVPQDDSTAAADALVQALGEFVRFTEDPIVVVCFTREPTYVETFRARFQKVFQQTPLLHVDCIEKENMHDDSEIQNLFNRIKKAVVSQAPLSLFFGWEQMVHDSTTATTASLNALTAQFSRKTNAGWSDCAFASCAALALAERGRRLEDEHYKFCLNSLYAILTPILADRLEHRVPQEAPPELTLAAKNLLTSVKTEVSRWNNKEAEPAHQPWPEPVNKAPDNQSLLKTTIEFLSKLVRPLIPTTASQSVSQKQPSDCGNAVLTSGVAPETSILPREIRASLNSALQLSFQVGNKELNPGNVYLYNERENSQPAGPVIGNVEDAKDNTFVLDRTSRKDVEPLFVEITPSCDFAQDKAKLPRFVLGFSFPPTLLDKFRRTQFTRLIDGPLFLTRDHEMNPSNVRFIALNAHYVFAISQRSAKNLKPFLRLRSPVLTDIVAWVGAHASRPGYASLAP